MYMAIASTMAHTAKPVQPVIQRRKCGFPALPNWVSIAVSSDSSETIAAIRLTALAADSTGLPQA